MASMRAAGGYVVTAGEFTREATKFSEGLNIQLLDGARLRQMIQSIGNILGETKPAAEQEPSTPSCPRCGAQMVKRTAKKGPQAGAEFWGCGNYPECRGTLSIGSLLNSQRN
jgi:restriction system protein